MHKPETCLQISGSDFLQTAFSIYYYNHFTALWTLPGTTQVSWYQKKTFTHSHLSWSSIIPCLLPPSFTIHGILVQFTCLTVFFHNHRPSFLWSTSWPVSSTSYSIDFFTQSLSSFCSTCSYHHNLVCCSTEILVSLTILSCSLMLHIHLTILISAH